MWWFTFTRSKFLKGWFTPRSNVFGRIFIIFLLEQRIVNWTIIQSWRKESLLCWMLLWINLRFLKYLRRSPQSDSCNKILNLGISLTNLRSQTEFRYRDWVFYGTFPRYFERGGYSPSARWKKRERRGQAFRDNRSFYIIGIHYTTPFSITEESARGTPLTETILWCFFFFSFFFLRTFSRYLKFKPKPRWIMYLSIQRGTRFFSLSACESTVKKKRARRVWHRETASISRRNQGWTLLSIHSPLNRTLFWIIGNKNTVERNRTWKMYSKACRKQLLWKLCDPKFVFQSISKIKKEERF